MCGIAGFVDCQRTAHGSPTVIVSMMETIRHRGPDGHGVYQDAYACLGHRRLSIIDVANGHQPMTNEDESLWITYNGEIFNHAGLRPVLEQKGHRYQTHCDTEAILHAYEEYGANCVDRFRGMFAFAIWDKKQRVLFAARDRLGIKPFYYYWNGSLFVFASEIKAILEHPAVSAQFAGELLPEYLAFGYASGEQTLFSGIRKLMPGHRLTLDVDSRTLSLERYWDVPVTSGEDEQRSESEWVAECRQRLEETVRMRLMSDVPLGMFLSGGVDSSAIAALMKRMVSTPVQTFAVGYAEAEYSELEYARAVARTIGTDHHEVRLSMEEFFHALPKLIWHEDEPITWPSSVSLYFVSRLAARHVKVVLTGEGSDELFAGYNRYRHYQFNSRWARRYRILPERMRAAIRQWVATSRLLSASARRKAQHTFVGRELGFESLQLDNLYCAFSASEQRSLLRSHFPPGAVYRSYLNYWEAEPRCSELRRMLYADQKTYLVELLMKQDQMSMACSIESRVPFLDHPLVEFSTRVPDSLKIKNGTGKYILKKAVEDLLPESILYRPKMGFPTPLRQWLLAPQAKPLLNGLLAPKSFLAEYLDLGVVAGLMERHMGGIEDHTDRIWRLLNLQLWGDLFLTGNRGAWLPGMTPSLRA